MAGSLDGLRFGVVGAGRVGRSLVGWLAAAGGELVIVGCRSGGPSAPTDRGIRRKGEGNANVEGIDRLTTEGLDLLIVSVPDPALPDVAAELANRPQAGVVLHTSGRRGPEALGPLREAGSAVGCLHPLRAFPRSLPDPSIGASTFFGLGGEPSALAMGRRIASGLGASHAEIPDEARSLYHLGATLAAGGVATVLAAAASIAKSAGLSGEVLEGYRTLALGAIQALPPGVPPRAITGPVARAEPAYVDQLRELEPLDPTLLPLARQLALATLDLLDRDLGPDPERESLRRRIRGERRKRERGKERKREEEKRGKQEKEK